MIITDQCKAFGDELIFFLKQSKVEQEHRLLGIILTVDEYWKCRMGTSAVGPVNALVEWVPYETFSST